MTYDPATDHDKPPGLFNHVTSTGRRARGLNSGKTWTVDGKRLKLREVVAAATGANMSAARRDIVNGVMSAQTFVDKYRAVEEAAAVREAAEIEAAAEKRQGTT